jgi:hypothetical protein
MGLDRSWIMIMVLFIKNIYYVIIKNIKSNTALASFEFIKYI